MLRDLPMGTVFSPFSLLCASAGPTERLHSKPLHWDYKVKKGDLKYKSQASQNGLVLEGWARGQSQGATPIRQSQVGV